MAVYLLCSCLVSCSAGNHDMQHQRYVEIRKLIKHNLHLSGHLVFAVDTRTVAAVRKQVTQSDIPVLIALLSDKENVVGIGAQHVLETFGTAALPGLEKVAIAADFNASIKAREAIAAIKSTSTATPGADHRQD